MLRKSSRRGAWRSQFVTSGASVKTTAEIAPRIAIPGRIAGAANEVARAVASAHATRSTTPIAPRPARRSGRTAAAIPQTSAAASVCPVRSGFRTSVALVETEWIQWLGAAVVDFV